jgi:hypothetical protein
MKLAFVTALLIGAIQPINVDKYSNYTNQEKLYISMRDDCPEVLANTADEMHYQLGQFSRTFDKKNWDNARGIYDHLAAEGKTPKIAVTTKELYDHSFSFPKVRNYDYAMENMNELEAAEDNLNKNILNAFALDNFIAVAKKVRTNLNHKYDIGFLDPANEDDWQ